MAEKSNMAHNPVIILGMHRSGTSMIVKMLQDCGVFFGFNKDENHEAWFFLNLNNWMLRQVNASWDNPFNFQFVNETMETQFKRVIELHMSDFLRRRNFLGWEKALRYHNIRDIDIPWGWKDPRNTFTIDIWRQIFPDAKILHIYRNPIDVARSMQNREEKMRRDTDRGNQLNFINAVKEYFLKGTVTYQQSVRVENLEQGIKLWKMYVGKAFELDKEFQSDILHIKYEDFLESPQRNYKKILKHIGLSEKDSVIDKSVSQINPERRYAFLKDKKLVNAYKKIKSDELVTKLEYHDLA